MHTTNSWSDSGLWHARAILVTAFILALATCAWGQTLAPRPGVRAKQPRWHKYVNHQFGFSFWYPAEYGPATDQRCTRNTSGGCLLWLESPVNSESFDLIYVEISSPFHLSLSPDDAMPERKLIGHHFFYCTWQGSMGVGFTDLYELDLKGKLLTFAFDEGIDREKQKQLVLKTLETFRRF